ncbi:YafY family protein [Paenibacillus campi]|uniref:helix-turn-helix transcriptional regulator n=1 Tax=Paenibacillus campi TaxID=3106031 RepID=UPI002AFE41F9|nr:YafY family protein [Paenibacillus sp. SGZ-1009]
MSKAQRLIELMLTVNTRRQFTASELARQFGVSRRTIQRDLQELAAAGVPLYAEPGAAGGYRVLRERMLPPILFSENEAVAMFFAYQSLRNYRSLPFQKESTSALDKFYHYLPSETKQRIRELQARFAFWTPARNLAVPYVAELVDYCVEQTVVQMMYDSSSGEQQRRVQPLGVYASSGLWYCVAYCFARKQLRTFRVDRIKQLVVDPHPRGKKDFSRWNISDYLGQTSAERTLPMKVWLEREGVRRCETDPWMEQGLTVAADGTGVLELALPESYVPWVVQFFASCGTAARVESPPELLAGLRAWIAGLQQQYGQEQ